jgi:phosphatidylinositol 3,5-bisphosphate 5-phosphatase
MINEGNKSNGGLIKLCTACGIVGFVKFLNGFYLTMITQKKEVGCIAGNYIYAIKATETFPIRPREEKENNTLKFLWKKLNKKLSQTTSEIAENRYLGLYQFIDMTKDFFFSYNYDLTHSIQFNYITCADSRAAKPQGMFEWNYHQIDGTLIIILLYHL